MKAKRKGWREREIDIERQREREREREKVKKKEGKSRRETDGRRADKGSKEKRGFTGFSSKKMKSPWF